ncbi:UDP-2,3-diacylglucosamine diphosphatase [Paracoccus sp. (in: a-proteobacteria)]|uniref:UDP-2,3-diacylglucosamine diphosphatase n=1 Tax=Paracoccus sp. TaxID=267 RepID=UPI0026E086D3|nr:UDP-2,3-diacylglucosamine diphosphatase [Paracoccus sp. (in: a-proteobacteria)]MDO5646985.1 UDP-2,3-diacylglucosamine diphosphatase [Paracoccus sp. (in: a-proteobacteria)]
MDDGRLPFLTDAVQHPPNERMRAIFLSDLHLGAMGCKARLLLSFLEQHDAETIYLVGDIIDTWRPLGSNWPDSHHAVLQLLTARARMGARVIFIPGNHDAFFRHHIGTELFGFDIRRDAAHRLPDGRRLLVTHGDSCDIFSERLSMLSKAGSWLESGIRRLGLGINLIRQRVGRDGWDGLETALARFNRMMRARDRFTVRLTDKARGRGFDGIVCGHFHQPALHTDHGVLYVNCGDWVEHCTVVMETPQGALRLIRWADTPEATTEMRSELVAG